MAFGYEIDFLAVGDGERSGDAIAMRYGEPGAYRVHVTDGGNRDTGDLLVQHIHKYYETDYVDLVVLTHVDDDHSSGLRPVLEDCRVGSLVMNRPWLYAAEVVHLFQDQRWTVQGLATRLRDNFPIVAELEDIAARRGTSVYEAFAGTILNDQFKILAPSRQRYLELIPQFSRTPQAERGALPPMPRHGLGLRRALQGAANWIRETWGIETLVEDPETSASNESSVIQLGLMEDKRIMLNGDAGVQGLNEAVAVAAALGHYFPGLDFMQVPHHGSRHNVSPSVLNHIIGNPLTPGDAHQCTAFASVAKESTTHPRKVVTNAFIRRGVSVHVTAGVGKRHHRNMPARANWSASTPVEFSEAVEA